MDVTTEHTKSDLHRLANDPSIIKGIHEACDQWCMYCPATRHCLAYRCSAGVADTIEWDTSATSANELATGIMFVNTLAEAEGRRPPPEIEAVLARGPRDNVIAALNDPLEHLGRTYMDVAEAYLESRPDVPFEFIPHRTGPTPLEVFAWYHALVPARIFRAILNLAEATDGVPGRTEDALCAAKVALLGIDRSLEALPNIAAADDDPRLQFLQTHLTRLQKEMEARFPDARAFRREGLDR